MTPHDLPCQEFVALVTEYLEGALSPDRVRQVDAHLSDCRHCRDYLDQIRVIIALIGQVHEDALDQTAWEQLRAAFRSS